MAKHPPKPTAVKIGQLRMWRGASMDGKDWRYIIIKVVDDMIDALVIDDTDPEQNEWHMNVEDVSCDELLCDV